VFLLFLRWNCSKFSIGSNVGASKPSIFGTNPTQPTTAPFGGLFSTTQQQQPPQAVTSAFGAGAGTSTSIFGSAQQNQPTSCKSTNGHSSARPDFFSQYSAILLRARLLP
jgi:hypothetical protein